MGIPENTRFFRTYTGVVNLNHVTEFYAVISEKTEKYQLYYKILNNSGNHLFSQKEFNTNEDAYYYLKDIISFWETSGIGFND